MLSGSRWRDANLSNGITTALAQQLFEKDVIE
jgi:hypothetical protein